MTDTNNIEVFTFGEPESVLDKHEWLNYLECGLNGRWYEPPVSFSGLARTFRAAVHHSSPIYVKRDILASCYIPHPLLPRSAFAGVALDYLVFGNAMVQRDRVMSGRPTALHHRLAKYMRVGKGLDKFWWVVKPGHPNEIDARDVFHWREGDVGQEIYGMPQYLSALNSVWLNEAATLFRRRYYKNGSHAGFILYMTDPAQSPEDVDNLRKALKDAKGPGNFRNLFMYAPNGKKDGIQLIPVAEVAAKDEFAGIKNVSRDDALAAHRVPPQLLGIMPNNVGGFGDVEKAARVFMANEIRPLMTRLQELNDWLGIDVITFTEYELAKSSDQST